MRTRKEIEGLASDAGKNATTVEEIGTLLGALTLEVALDCRDILLMNMVEEASDEEIDAAVQTLSQDKP